MKKLLASLLLLFALKSFGQFPSNPVTGNIAWNNHWAGAITGDRGVLMGTQVDTAAWNALPYVKTVPFILVNTSSDGKTWRRNSAATKWEEISVGASGWSLTGNIGTSPGTNFLGTTDNVGLMFKVNSIQAGFIDVDGASANTSIGQHTLESVTSGTENNAFGTGSLANTTSGSNNMAFGGASLGANTTGSNNVGAGYNTISAGTTGSSNTAIGYDALASGATGSYNIGVGNEAGSHMGLYFSNRLFINSIDRTNQAGDSTQSIIYGAQDATASNQRLYLNSAVYLPYAASGVGTKALRINPGTGLITYADTTIASTGLTVGTTTIASGTNTRVLYDNGGALGEYSVTGSTNVVMSASPTLTGTISAAALTQTGQYTNSLNGAASTPPMTLTGTMYSGGSTTTTKTTLLIEPSGATSNTWSTAGGLLGVNTSGYTGYQYQGKANGVTSFGMSVTGAGGYADLQLGSYVADNTNGMNGRVKVYRYNGDEIGKIEASSSGYLVVNGSTESRFQIGGITAMTITSSQKVGIGTTSPAATLDIKGANTIDGLRVRLTGANPFLAQFFNDGYSSSSAVFQYFAYNNGNFRMGNPNALSTGIYSGSASGYATPNIIIKSNGDVGIGGSAGTSGDAFGSPTLVALNAGNVGIGTTSPGEKLEINGNGKLKHLIGGSSTPTGSIITGGGGTSDLTFTGTDLAGLISYTPDPGGSIVSAGSDLFSVTFATAYASAPNIVLMSRNDDASNYNIYVKTASTTGFTISLSSTGNDISAGMNLKWYYQVIQ